MESRIGNMLVDEELSLIDVIKNIDINANGIVYVAKNNKLIGSITDGDVRRYILAHASVSGVAKNVMNVNPKYLRQDEVENVNDFMIMHSIHSVPILNDEDEIVNIIYLYETKGEKPAIDIPVVIMAGGKGTRMMPYTQILPKPLIPINGKTITELIIESFADYHCKRIGMIVNYKKEFIKAYFQENENNLLIDFYEEETFLGTAGGLKLLEENMKETFFLNNCDILIEEDYKKMYDYHKENNNIITLVCAVKKEVFPYGTLETDKNGKVIKLKEKPTFEFLTNTGLYIIEPEFLKEIPENVFIHITDVIQNCIDKGIGVGVYPICEENWMDMGQLDEFEKMKKRLENK